MKTTDELFQKFKTKKLVKRKTRQIRGGDWQTTDAGAPGGWVTDCSAGHKDIPQNGCDLESSAAR